MSTTTHSMGFLRLCEDIWNLGSATQMHGLYFWRRTDLSPCSWHGTLVPHGQAALSSLCSWVLFDGNTKLCVFQPLCQHQTWPTKKVLAGSVAGQKPNFAGAAPQGALMNWIIIDRFAQKTPSTQMQMGGHISPYSTYNRNITAKNVGYAASRVGMMNGANYINKIRIHRKRSWLPRQTQPHPNN